MRILYDPAPRTSAEIFSSAELQQFLTQHDVIEVEADSDPSPSQSSRSELYAKHLPQIDILISQQPMPRERLAAAPNLRAIFNVETNFLPNVDYDTCFERGIHVLTPASVFAVPVAEIGLGLALSLARDIHTAHGDFQRSEEQYGLQGNSRAELLSNSQIGFIGFGDLGRALLPLLKPFGATISVYDPWLPDEYLRRQGLKPVSLNELLEGSRLVFVVASVTSANQHLLNRETLARLQDNAMLILLSRAALADFDALAQEAKSGRLRIATDVFPVEPVPADDPIRKVPNMLFSAHRAGALTGALQQIGALVMEDLQQIDNGLPPVSCRRAERETIGLLRSQPIEKS